MAAEHEYKGGGDFALFARSVVSLTCKFCYLPSEDVIRPRRQEEGDSARLRALHIVSLTFCHSNPIFCSLPFFGAGGFSSNLCPFTSLCHLLARRRSSAGKAKTGTGPSEKQHGPSCWKGMQSLGLHIRGGSSSLFPFSFKLFKVSCQPK